MVRLIRSCPRRCECLRIVWRTPRLRESFFLLVSLDRKGGADDDDAEDEEEEESSFGFSPRLKSPATIASFSSSFPRSLVLTVIPSFARSLTMSSSIARRLASPSLTMKSTSMSLQFFKSSSIADTIKARREKPTATRANECGLIGLGSCALVLFFSGGVCGVVRRGAHEE